jgi:hypothetical protein
VKRHARRHLPRALVLATDAARVVDADLLLDQVQGMQRRARVYQAQAASEGNVRIALLALREGRALAEFLGRLTGALREHVEVHQPGEEPQYVAVAEVGRRPLAG